MVLPNWNTLTTEAMELLWRTAVRPLSPGMVRAMARGLFSRSWRRFERAAADPAAAQAARLQQLVAANRQTAFGREHGFDRIRTLADYQRQVPIRSYDQLEPWIERTLAGEPNVLTAQPIVYFARTSGTTGAAKFIPITADFLDEYRHGRRVWTRQVAQAFPGLVRGHVLTVRSTRTEGTTPGGVAYGPLSVALGNRDPGAAGSLGALLRPIERIPPEVFAIADYRSRLYLLLRLALPLRISLLAAINPSTLALLARKLDAWALELIADCRRGGLNPALQVEPELRAVLTRHLAPAPRAAERLQLSRAAHGRVRPTELWPDLCGLLCWKAGSAAFYLRQLGDWFGDLPLMDYCYAATEGNFTVVMSPEGAGGVAAAAGHLMEFVPEDAGHDAPDAALPLERLETGRRYWVVVSAGNGLYRYRMDDLVEVTGYWRRAPELVFLHKGKHILSYTGEKLSESQVVAAMQRAQRRTGIELVGFCASALAETELPVYTIAVEPDRQLPAERWRRLLHAWERELGQANIEYRGKRQSGRLAPPQLWLVEHGAFERWRKQRLAAGATDAQVKLPQLTGDAEDLRRLGVVATVGWQEEPE